MLSREKQDAVFAALLQEFGEEPLSDSYSSGEQKTLRLKGTKTLVLFLGERDGVTGIGVRTSEATKTVPGGRKVAWIFVEPKDREFSFGRGPDLRALESGDRAIIDAMKIRLVELEK